MLFMANNTLHIVVIYIIKYISDYHLNFAPIPVLDRLSLRLFMVWGKMVSGTEGGRLFAVIRVQYRQGRGKKRPGYLYTGVGV